MADEEKTSPALRFKGFSDAWEQRKLKDHAKYRRGSFPQPYGNKEWYDGKGSKPFVQVVDVGENLQLVENTKQKISKLAQSKSVFVPAGKVVVTLQGSIGRVAITQYDSYVDRTLLIFDEYQLQTNEHFWAYTIQQKFEIEKKKAPGGTIKTITKEALSEFEVFLPKYEEQQKIGSFFKIIDTTIALHQRQSDTYKELKKSMLQKMFPQDGEKVPEIRFDGFTEEWERRSLNSIVKRVTRKNKNLESSLPLTISAQHGLVDQNTFFNKQVASKDVSGYYLVKKGEFAYNKSYSSGYPWGAIKRLDNYDMGVLSTLYIVFQPVNIVSDFLVTYYDTNLWHKEVSMRAAEGARNHGLLNISAQDFFETELIISTNTEEQARIGCYFKQLDDTIALHKQKTTCLQILKNSLLNKMFI